MDSTKHDHDQLKSSAIDLRQRPLRRLEIPIDWQSTISRLKEQHRDQAVAVMVCGPQGSGKSTFGRVLVNALLTVKPNLKKDPNPFPISQYTGTDGIAFLDLDPGQPEFSPPGNVSLIHMRFCNFGVPFTHPMVDPSEGSKVLRSHHLGALSPKDNPDHYQKCAWDLLQRYKVFLSHHQACSLVVNCSGWVQGSGLEVLTGLIHHMAFTHVVYMSTTGPEEVVETLKDATLQAKVPFHRLSSQSSEFFAPARTASDLRMMQTLSYFHLDAPEGGYLRWNPSPLNETAPLIVHYSGRAQSIFAIMILGDEQDPEMLAGVLEGSVVGLVALESDSAIPSERSDDQCETLEVEPEKESAPTLTSDWQPKFDLARTQTMSISSDDDSEDASISSFQGSDSHPSAARRPPQGLGDGVTVEAVSTGSNTHLQHRSVSRTPEGLPYLSTGIGTQPPLDPSRCHSVGQALIRGIDPQSQTIHLITPVPPTTLQRLHRQQTKLVLVRGMLHTPTWAYHEEYVRAAAQRRRTGRDDGGAEPFGPEEMKAWAQGTPWAHVVDETEAPRTGAKAWRARRHLRAKGDGGGRD